MSAKHVDRRSFLTTGLGIGGGLIGLGAAGYAGYELHHEPSSSDVTPPNSTIVPAATTSTFVTRPDLNPPKVTLTRMGGWLAPAVIDGAYYFVAPKRYAADGSGQSGSMILDQTGSLVWFGPSVPHQYRSDLQVQTYKGQPVLTWWSGLAAGGHGEGYGYIADTSYNVIATVRAGNGMKADSHEFCLTPEGTAFLTTYYKEKADLSSIGGPKDGYVMGCQAQEIDIATGKLLHAWDSLEHIGVEESEVAFRRGSVHHPFDYFHINSISLASDGNVLISARNTCAIYKVHRTTGAVIWRLNGKNSDFTMGEGTNFYWQHHSRAHSGNRLSLFDDAATPNREPQSRGLLLDVNETTMTCTLERAYVTPTKLLAANQGSMQVLDDGGVVVGWGDLPYFSEFKENGTMVMNARFPADDQSYRAFRFNWSGEPSAKPDVVAAANTSAFTIYVSWNGDTRTSTWSVLAGATSTSLTQTAIAPRSGFETVISVPSLGPYFSVIALDDKGNQLAQSAVVRA